jgi:hypothetical protein
MSPNGRECFLGDFPIFCRKDDINRQSDSIPHGQIKGTPDPRVINLLGIPLILSELGDLFYFLGIQISGIKDQNYQRKYHMSYQ